MKNKSIICALLLACGVGISTTSCEDMLSADSDRTIHTNANDTLYGYWGIMKAMQNLAERYVILGEARGDLAYPTSNAADSISNIANFNSPQDGDCRYLEVKDFYTVINGCNNYLAKVDSLKTNSNGDKVMQKEVAQIQAMRAWTYLQLVNNYGEVPYYTEPITSLGFIDDFDFTKVENKLNRETLVEKLIPLLAPYQNVVLPNYGNYNNGAQDIASTLTMFPIKLVMGDIYLTGALGQDHYEQAAQCYYDYLKDNGAYLPIGYNTTAIKVNDEVLYGNNSWASTFSATGSPVGKGYNGEAITVIPSSAGKLYGTVLTGIANVFGYQTNSSMDTDSEEGNESEATTSASVTASRNPSYRQLGPSQQYFSLCSDQQYIYRETTDLPVQVMENAGDARQYGVDKITTSLNGVASELSYVRKPCFSGFSYTFPVIYRKALVWLRYAEAVNRAGFPSYAFAVLKTGLCKDYLPEYINKVDTVSGDTTQIYYTINKACGHIPESEFIKAKNKPYLTFSCDFTYISGTEAANVGVHSRGCGLVGIEDTVYYTYKNMLFKKCVEAGIDTTGILAEDSLPYRIDAIENLIVDELALETAWEGNRYPDLLRIASHKGDAGIKWFADKIARRGDPRDPEVPYGEGNAEYDALFNKLNDQTKKNWYLTLPSYK